MPNPLVLPALLGGIASLGSTAAGNLQSVHNFRNRYQWTAQDMKAAGINPIMAASMGLGGGPSAQAFAPNIADSASQLANTALSEKQIAGNLEKIDAEIDQLQALKNLTMEQKEKVKQEVYLVVEQTLGQQYQNIENSVKADFLIDNKWLIQAGEISDKLGISVRDLTQVASIILGVKNAKIQFKDAQKRSR